jgi:hypothetical protein
MTTFRIKYSLAPLEVTVEGPSHLEKLKTLVEKSILFFERNTSKPGSLVPFIASVLISYLVKEGFDNPEIIFTLGGFSEKFSWQKVPNPREQKTPTRFERLLPP